MQGNLQKQPVIAYTHDSKNLAMILYDEEIHITKSDDLTGYQEAVIEAHKASPNFHTINNAIISLSFLGEQNEPYSLDCACTEPIIQYIHENYLKNLSLEERHDVLTEVIKNLKIQDIYKQEPIQHTGVFKLQNLCKEPLIK